MADKAEFTPEEEEYLRKAFLDNLSETAPRAEDLRPTRSCSCSGCSCPPGGGDICDGGTYVGYTGGYYGAASA